MIHPTAIVYPNVIIEEGAYIGAYCIIGAPPEHLAHWNKDTNKRVVIKKGAVIHGHATIDRGVERDTVIGENAFIMKSVHIGHDAEVGEGVIISPHAIIGGHVTIGANTNIGMGAIVHQRKNIPSGCMIGMGAVITKKSDIWQDGVFVGNPAYFLRSNKR